MLLGPCLILLAEVKQGPFPIYTDCEVGKCTTMPILLLSNKKGGYIICLLSSMWEAFSEILFSLTRCTQYICKGSLFAIIQNVIKHSQKTCNETGWNNTFTSVSFYIPSYYFHASDRNSNAEYSVIAK